MTDDRGRETRRRARAAVAVVGALVIAVEAYLLATGQVTELPRTPLRADSFLVDDLAKGYRVSQTVQIGAGGFNEIHLRASPLGTTPSGQVTLTLYDEGAGRLIYRDVVRARDVIREPTFVFRFPEIRESAGRSYRLDLRMSGANPETGIGLWATDGRWSGGGSLFINGQSAFSELVFETRARQYATLWARLDHRFDGLGLIGFVLLAACAHGVFFVVVYSLMTMPPDSRGALS